MESAKRGATQKLYEDESIVGKRLVLLLSFPFSSCFFRNFCSPFLDLLFSFKNSESLNTTLNEKRKINVQNSCARFFYSSLSLATHKKERERERERERWKERKVLL